MAAGMERGSWQWTTGVLAIDLIGGGSAVSMSTVKLEGVGEGMFAELAEDMLEGMGQWSWFSFDVSFYPSSPLLYISHDNS